jgi:hypothetical protein
MRILMQCGLIITSFNRASALCPTSLRKAATIVYDLARGTM